MSKPPESFIHRYVPGSGIAATTTLLLLHGTGGDENDLLDLGRTLFPGAALLSPRGKILENGMPRFFRRLAEGIFDVEDLQRRTLELADFVQEACSTYALDPHRVIAVGYSNGANIASSTLLIRPEILAAAVLFRGMVPFVPAANPDLSGKSLLLSNGSRDPIIPTTETKSLLDLFLSAGASVQIHRHEGGHELGKDDIAIAQTWVSQLALTSQT